VFSAALMVVGGTIGSGIFFTPAEVAHALPSGGWIMAVWVLGGVVALCGALSFAELGAMMPDAGGGYVYIREAFGPLASFLAVWMVTLMIASGAIAAVALGFAGYMARFVDLAPVGGQMGAAIGTIIVMTATNYAGVRPGVVMMNVLTGAKIAALATLIVAGLFLWSRLGSSVVAQPVAAPESLISGFATAFVAVLFTCGGWQQLNMVGGEIRDPQRTIPRALIIGVLIIVAIYLGANAVYLRALGRDGLAGSQAVAADAMTAMLGPGGATFISVAAMISIAGFVNVALLGNSRVPFALAADRLFFKAVGHVHPRFGTPHVAIALLGGWAILLLAATQGRIGTLLSGVVFADWIFFGLGAASIFVLRRTHPDRARPYRVVGYPVVPALFVLSAIAAVSSAIVSAPRMSAVGVAMLAAGVVAFGVFSRRRAAGL
jgi:APA family basic amino acid/polyamine antiporter